MSRLEEMVKVLQDERDALLSTRPWTGGFPLPDSLSELSTLVEMKTREPTLVQEDGERVAKLSSFLATVGNKIANVKTRSSRRTIRHDVRTLVPSPGQ